MTTADQANARELAEFYRLRGFQPLPSSPREKRPLCRYAEYWEREAPADLWDHYKTSNIQVMTGRHWRLLVIDLDGPEAIERWSQLGRTPRTWITHSGGGGRHLWFRLPAAYPHKLSKAFLWIGEGKHSAIERLCDLSLVMAPPSIHPRTGERYRFLDRYHSPLSLSLPADCPDWVLRLRPLAHSGCVAPSVTQAARFAHDRPCTPRPRASAPPSTVMPVALAKSWGIRFTGKVSRTGWAECHAFDRDDEKPSAAIHTEHGGYCDLGSGTKLSLAQLGVALRQFDSIKDALAQLQPGGFRDGRRRPVAQSR